MVLFLHLFVSFLISFITRKTSNKQPNLHLKQLENEEQKNPKVSKRKETIKIRAEIIENEMNETIAKINKTESWFFEKINKIKFKNTLNCHQKATRANQ